MIFHTIYLRPKGDLVIVFEIGPYSVKEYEGAALRREAKEHRATRIFDTKYSPFKALAFFASFFLQ